MINNEFFITSLIVVLIPGTGVIYTNYLYPFLHKNSYSFLPSRFSICLFSHSGLKNPKTSKTFKA